MRADVLVPCPRCGKQINANPLSRAGHARMHSRHDKKDFADRARAGTLTKAEVDALPWQIAKAYLQYIGEVER